MKDRKKVAKLATQLYFSAVIERMGGITPAKLHRHFCKQTYKSNSEYNSQNSRVIYKYLKGQVAVKDLNLIDNIEKELPGVKQLLNHPLWLILDNPSADLSQIHQYMRQLDWDIQAKLFKQEKETNSYSRRVWKKTAPFSHISFKNDIDALACFLMLIREQEILANWHCFVIAKWHAHELFLRISFFEPVSIIRDELYNRIFFDFFEQNNPITPKHFNSELDFTAYEEFLHSPSLITNFSVWDHVFEIVVKAANNYGVDADTKAEKLKLLFWAFEIDVKEAILLTSENCRRSISDNPYLNKLISAYHSTNHQMHIKNYLIKYFQ